MEHQSFKSSWQTLLLIHSSEFKRNLMVKSSDEAKSENLHYKLITNIHICVFRNSIRPSVR